jgi:hypothetical protein
MESSSHAQSRPFTLAFMYRMSLDSLSVVTKASEIYSLNCHVYDEEIEDELHVFFKCKYLVTIGVQRLSSILHNNVYQQTRSETLFDGVCFGNFIGVPPIYDTFVL